MKGKEFEPDEYDIIKRIPEEMSVGKLNNVVRELRELLYQQRIKTQHVESLLSACHPSHPQDDLCNACKILGRVK